MLGLWFSNLEQLRQQAEAKSSAPTAGSAAPGSNACGPNTLGARAAQQEALCRGRRVCGAVQCNAQGRGAQCSAMGEGMGTCGMAREPYDMLPGCHAALTTQKLDNLF